MKSSSSKESIFKVTPILQHAVKLKPIVYSFQDRPTTIKGDTPTQGNTITFADNGNYLHWTTHDNILDLYENDTFHLAIHFDTPIVPGAFISYDANGIFTLAVATQHKVYTEIVRIPSLHEGYEVLLKSIASAAHSVTSEKLTYSSFISENADSGKLFVLTSSSNLYTAKVRVTSGSPDVIHLERLPVDLVADGAGGEGAMGFFKGLLWGRSSEIIRNKALGICPLGVYPKGAFVASVDDNLALKIWDSNVKMPVASFFLDGSSKSTDKKSCDVQLCGFSVSFDKNSESENDFAFRIIVSCLLSSCDDETTNSKDTYLKIFSTKVSSQQFGCFEINKPIIYEEVISQNIIGFTPSKEEGEEGEEGENSIDVEDNVNEIPKHVVVKYFSDDVPLYIYYYLNGKHIFKTIKMNNFDDGDDSNPSVMDAKKQAESQSHILFDADMTPICGLTQDTNTKEVLCTSESSVSIIRKSTAFEVPPSTHSSPSGLPLYDQSIEADFEEMFELSNHRDEKAYKTLKKELAKLKVNATEKVERVKSEIDDVVARMTRADGVVVDSEGGCNTVGCCNTFVGSLLVQYYKALFSRSMNLLIRINAFKGRKNDPETDVLIQNMKTMKVFIFLLSAKNDKNENVVIKKYFPGNEKRNDDKYCMAFMNKVYSEVFGNAKSFEKFVSFVFDEKMYNHVTELVEYFVDFKTSKTVETKGKCSIELGNVPESYDLFIEHMSTLQSLTKKVQFLHRAIDVYKSYSLTDYVDRAADYGVSTLLTGKIELKHLRMEYTYFVRSKFDCSLERKDFAGIKGVLHHSSLATLYFAQNSELITRFVSAVIAAASSLDDATDYDILLEECSAGFRRVIFQSLLKLGFAQPLSGAYSYESDHKNPFEIAYKIAVTQEDYQTAATVMFFYAQKVRSEISSACCVSSLLLAKNLYGRSLASLKLVDDDNSKWILNTPSNYLLLGISAENRLAKNSELAESENVRAGLKRSFDETVGCARDASCDDLITVERLEKILVVSTCEYSLAKKCGCIDAVLVKKSDRVKLVGLLVENALIDDAFLLGKAYPELNALIFRHPRIGLNDPNNLLTSEKVHRYLRMLGKADYYKDALCGIFASSGGKRVMVADSNDKLAAVGGECVTLPWWVVSEFLGVCPSELFKTLFELSLFNVIDRALDCVDKEDIPYLQLEAIYEELKADTYSDVKASIVKKIRSLIKK